MERKIIIDTGALYRLGDDEKSFKAIKDGGFSYYDYSLYWKGTTEHIGVDDDYKEIAHQTREIAEKYGLSCEQAHAYFCNGNSPEIIKKRIEYNKKDIEIAKILGAKIVVFHPVVDWSIEENAQLIIKEFLPLAHRFDIKIAIENVFKLENGSFLPCCTSKPEGLKRILDIINDEYVCACVDIGHAEIKSLNTSAVEMIKELGSRIGCLHIHDNSNNKDSHQMPYTQEINFSEILNALKSVNYKGNITFEIETCYVRGENPSASLPFELYPAFIRLQHDIGEYFVNYLDKENI